MYAIKTEKITKKYKNTNEKYEISIFRESDPWKDIGI